MELVDGKKIARKITCDLEKRIGNVEKQLALSVILVGKSAASENFVSQKKEICNKLGIDFDVTRFESTVEQENILQKIKKLNNNRQIDGILVQLPLPNHINEHEIFGEISPKKDVDSLCPLNQGKLMRGNLTLMPATVKSIEHIFKEKNIGLKGKEVTIVNNSNLIGKPLSMFLTNNMATVSICHKHTENLKRHTQKCDILITATGQSRIIGKEHISKDTAVIDAGYAFEDGKIVGDVKEDVKELASLYTPVPGGVGPLTVISTIENLIQCYEIQKKGS